jgi:adenylyltransferase/sulfurtransferase
MEAMQDRFSRQVRFASLGPDGQERIGASRVLLVGVGALGTHIAGSLVRAGVGTLWLVDRDIVELDNLQRQVLFDEDDARHGRAKAPAAAAHLRRVNSRCDLRPIAEEFTAEVFAALGAPPDLILDGTDNFATRYLINDLAARAGIPWVYGGAVGATGAAMAVVPGRTPCLRCFVPEAPPAGEVGTCETDGILEPAVAAVAAFQSAQALKILAGRLDAVASGALAIDVWADRWGVRLRSGGPDPSCPACSGRDYPALRAPALEPVLLCGRAAAQVFPQPGARVDLPRLAAHLQRAAEDIELTPELLRFRADGCRFSVFPGGRALVFGVTDAQRARVLYDRYVGAC